MPNKHETNYNRIYGWLIRVRQYFPMPYNLQFSLCISVFQMESAYLSFIWICPEVVDSAVWSQACECVTKSLFHLLKGVLLCGNAQIIGVQETPGVRMNRLVICINVEHQRGKDAAFWKAILLSAPSAVFTDEVHKKRLLDTMFWISSVSIMYCVISCNILVRIMWFTERSAKAAPNDYTFLVPSSMNCVRVRSDYSRNFLA